MIDLQDELAIFQLLAEDFRAISGEAQPNDISTTGTHSPNGDIAVNLIATDAQIARDQAYAELLQSQEASLAVSRQYAHSLAAEEQKSRLDREFARTLQEGDEDDTSTCDADSLLGREAIAEIFASDPDQNGKGKGKGQASTPEDDLALLVGKLFGSTSSALDDATSKNFVQVYPTCGICGDAFQDTHSPISASLSANSSTRLPFGLRLPCPDQHAYCVGCLSQYIISKLDPDGTGGAPEEQIIFPIRCPECPSDKWVDGLQDDVAERILTKDGTVLWYHRKLLDSLPRYYCPNRQCSALVQLHEETGEPQATCPLCQMVMCVPCKTQWHNDLTCEEYQDLPVDERSPEDQLLIQLAKEKKWRRCKACGRMIELAFGCNHMTCACGNHFCFKCGAVWDTKVYKCSRGAGCELWEDEEMLLEEDQRHGRANVQEAVPQQAAIPAPLLDIFDLVAPPRYQEALDTGNFEWILEGNIMATQHNFTCGMFQQLSCGYCGSIFNDLVALRHHLASIQRHPVYSCCGKFFRLREHYLQHRSALMDHHHTCVRGDDEA